MNDYRVTERRTGSLHLLCAWDADGGMPMTAGDASRLLKKLAHDRPELHMAHPVTALFTEPIGGGR